MAASRVSRRGFVGGVATALGAMDWHRDRRPLGARDESLAPAPLAHRPRRGVRRVREAREQREPVRAARLRHEGDDARDEVREPLRVSGRRASSTRSRSTTASKPENVLLAAGSGEILDVCGTTFLQDGPHARRRGPVVQHLLLARDVAQGGHHQGSAAARTSGRTFRR